MKTKHIFKLFTIITMLMLAIFTTGCESQQEKYTKASNELATYEKEQTKLFYEKLNKMDNKIAQTKNKTEKVKIINEMCKDAFKDIDNLEKNTKERLENLQKIAKGDTELEKDVRLKWEEFNKKSKNRVMMKNKLDNFIKDLQK